MLLKYPNRFINGGNMVTAYDLINLIEKDRKCFNNTFLEVQELIYNIKNNKMFIKDLENELQSYAKDRGLCPYCGEELESYNVNINTLEYQGTLCYEQKDLYYCSKHGEIV